MTLIKQSEFLSALRNLEKLPEDEVARIAELLPGAYAAGQAALGRMPGIGVLSNRCRAEAFVAICAHIDELASDQGLTQEQCQLALAVIQMSDRRAEKAKVGFLARLPRLSSEARDSLPEAAKHLLFSIHLMQCMDRPNHKKSTNGPF